MGVGVSLGWKPELPEATMNAARISASMMYTDRSLALTITPPRNGDFPPVVDVGHFLTVITSCDSGEPR